MNPDLLFGITLAFKIEFVEREKRSVRQRHWFYFSQFL
jgi:hypothetical protein